LLPSACFFSLACPVATHVSRCSYSCIRGNV
jgi:hypothetical protein